MCRGLPTVGARGQVLAYDVTGSSPDAGTSGLRIVIACPTFEPGYRGGGPVRSMSEIIRTAPGGDELFMITRDRDLGDSKGYPGLSGRWVDYHSAQVFYLNTKSVSQWIALVRKLRNHRLDCLYVNSFWDPPLTLVPLVAVAVRLVRVRSLLVAPRGELSAGALSLKRRKKALFLTVWRPLLRSLHPTWHASSPLEAAEIRRLFPAAEVYVGPDPSSLPNVALNEGEPHEGPTRLVFVSRISPKKNLAAVLEALRGMSAPIQFDIYGPKEDVAYWRRCEELIRRLPKHVVVQYCGILSSDAVTGTFNSYDAFAFPTLGENFGHVIAESLSASCPVICSDTTPWTSVLRDGGGSVLPDMSSASLQRELERYAALSPSDRTESKRRAGQAYGAWRAVPRDRHIFDQIRPDLGRGGHA